MTIAVLLAVGLLFVAKPTWDSAMDASVHACAASIHQSVENFWAKSSRETGIALGADWRELSPAEYDQIMVRVKNAGTIDKGRSYWDEDGRFVDPWGRPYHIAGRVMPSGAAEFTVWSSGRDGVSGTPDDLVWPYGKKAPEVR